jgi:hypothetical protein
MLYEVTMRLKPRAARVGEIIGIILNAINGDELGLSAVDNDEQGL